MLAWGRGPPLSRIRGTAWRIKADLEKADKGAFSLTLTEFSDPNGQWTCFGIADPKTTVDDGLLVAAKQTKEAV